ncbi:hypothetical protein [Streptomyces sp. SID8352]|uniref:hypothetical protein n=1 Tax=Streptomyces sp. SID8352 TaxID=2690338 RepID=UPI00136C93F9|nr:hypothetical protein [Streptomyces sp. SID8352]MYU22925.1 hypothetical protein [Streptomyces sp. SID8352]
MTTPGADERRIRALLLHLGVGPQAPPPPAARPAPPARHRPHPAGAALDACALLAALHGLVTLLT